MTDIVYMIEKPQENGEMMGRSSPSSDRSESSSAEGACVSCIDDTILPPRRKLPEPVAKKFTSAGLKLAVVTLVCTLAMTVFGFFTSDESDSSATFGFAFDSFFALVSSCILIWRFGSNNQTSYTIAKRETHATAVVAICMVVSSIAIFARAINCLYHAEKPSKPMELLILTSASFFVYTVLFVMKGVVATKLGSGCLMTDAMDSMCGAIFAFSILVSAVILKFTTKVWFLDSTIAIIVSVCSFVYGLIVLEKLVRLFRKREEMARRECEEEQLLTDAKEIFEDEKSEKDEH